MVLVMIAAFSTWRKRIAPVFDVSREVRLVEVCPDRKTLDQSLKKIPGPTRDRCLWLAGEKVQVLVCGAISKVLQKKLELMKIQVVPFVAGQEAAVIQAWLENRLINENFIMPGCCCRIQGALRLDKEVTQVRNKNLKQSCCKGAGRSQQGQGQGSDEKFNGINRPVKKGSSTKDNSSWCTCPSCGCQVNHEKGTPCRDKECPECGQTMRGRT